jgi:hypothetical protein
LPGVAHAIAARKGPPDIESRAGVAFGNATNQGLKSVTAVLAAASFQTASLNIVLPKDRFPAPMPCDRIVGTLDKRTMAQIEPSSSLAIKSESPFR